MQVSTPGAKDGAVLVRIFGGKKTGGARRTQQACYVCLLYKLKCTSASPWMYATMPNVESVWAATANEILCAPTELMSEIEEELGSLTLVTVSGAIQQAGNAIPVECKSARKRKQSV